MITVQKILFLKRISIFKSLTSQELRMISEVVTEEEFSPGEVLFSEGQQGDCMFFVVEGKISIYTGSPPKIKTLAVFEGGDFFGEMGLFDDKPRSASAMAADFSRLLVLRKVDFCELIGEYPEVALGIMKELNQRLRETNIKLNSFEGRYVDRTSQLYTREYFVECLSNEFLKAKKDQVALSFVTMRVEVPPRPGGGKVADSAYEQLVCDLGRIMTMHQRPSDLTARLSRERIVIMLTEASREGAKAFQQRVSRDMDKLLTSFQEAHEAKTEVVFKTASFPDDTIERESMLAILDRS